MLKGFPPIIDKNIRILILGSFPSEESLKRGEYYAHPKNQFWRIIGDIVGEDLRSESFDEKKKVLLRNNIGLWDVLSACEREGSLDSKIKKEKPNEFTVLKKFAPDLRVIVFNGKKAGNYAKNFQDYKTSVLPSTSPAFTMKYSDKLAAWREAFSLKN